VIAQKPKIVEEVVKVLEPPKPKVVVEPPKPKVVVEPPKPKVMQPVICI
jgi:hypothetical protein